HGNDHSIFRSKTMSERRGEPAVAALDDPLLFQPTRDTTFHAPVPVEDPLQRTISRAGASLLGRQYADGYWRFDLEADTTIPAEYLLLQKYLGRFDAAFARRIAAYILGRQLPDGSWPLYDGGPGNLSATVKSYFALKLAGVEPSD